MTTIYCDCCGADKGKPRNFPTNLREDGVGLLADACKECIIKLNKILEEFQNSPEERSPEFTAYLKTLETKPAKDCRNPYSH